MKLPKVYRIYRFERLSNESAPLRQRNEMNDRLITMRPIIRGTTYSHQTKNKKYHV